MKKLLFSLVSTLILAASASASTNISDDFAHGYSATANLSAYNKDINTLIGLSDFHTGKATSFPGFDVGGSFSAVKVSKKNNISSEDYLMTAFVRAETYIPVVGVTAVLRGTDLSGFESIGGGLKYTYNILELVNLSLTGFYDHAKTDYYKTDHYSASAVASTSVLFFTPYVGVGYDYGDFSVRKIGNRSTTDSSMRYTAGVNFHPFPFFYVFAAYTKTSGNQGFNGGIGINL